MSADDVTLSPTHQATSPKHKVTYNVLIFTGDYNYLTRNLVMRERE